MKYSFLLALIAVATTEAASIEQQSAQRYTYEDIREQELKCKADRNREWKYDAATNTWACPLQRYDWGSSGSAQNWPSRASSGMINFINHPTSSYVLDGAWVVAGDALWLPQFTFLPLGDSPSSHARCITIKKKNI